MPSIFRLLTHVALGLGLLAVCSSAQALDKQGAAHAGEVEGPNKGQEIGGSLLLGVALYNPSYAARPNNTGLALFRIAPHFDFDLIGHRLSIPLDLNVFTDRRRDGAEKLIPTELDVITGLTSTWGVFRGGALEFGARYERDMPLDRPGLTQSYADARAKLLLSLDDTSERLKERLTAVDLTANFTLGCFAYNPTYAARPDNTGLALFRYAAHVDLAIPVAYLGLYVDSTFFTDRHTQNKVRPSELDLTVGVAVRLDPFEISVAYERDMPLDRGRYTQQMVFLYGSWAFTAYSNQPKPAAVETAEPSKLQ